MKIMDPNKYEMGRKTRSEIPNQRWSQIGDLISAKPTNHGEKSSKPSDKLASETRYYHILDGGVIAEIELNRDNWWYVQLDASIRFAFMKYNQPLPKYVVLEEEAEYVAIHIFRNDITDVVQALTWKENCGFIQEELDTAAGVNSMDDHGGVMYNIFIY